MVRQSKQTTDEKKESHKKKTQQQDKPSPKKPSDSTVWPCRINGCNKQFAREADLKRHQRTTKLHSVPGFACPQCDARFTRTDALRRHQKSRHNGLVIEPTDEADRRPSTFDEDHPSSGSRSKSRSRSPPSKENPAAPSSLSPTVVPPGGPQGYYRQHTFTGVLLPPMGDGHYPPAARLHQASWQSTPAWGGDSSHPPHPHVIHPGYAHPYYNAPQYYRPATVTQPPDVTKDQVPNGAGLSSNGESSSSRTGSPVLAVDPSLDHTGVDNSSKTADADAVVIDPSLVSPSGSSIDNGDSCADDQVPRVRKPSSHSEHISSPGVGRPPSDAASNTDSETTIVRHLLSPSHDDPFPSHHTTHLEHHLDIGHLLTEDGEPMLNPAELLTQESLASPPPS